MSSVPRLDNTNTRILCVCVAPRTRARLPRVYYTCTDEIVHAPFVTHLPLVKYHRLAGRKVLDMLLEKLAQTKRKARRRGIH